MKNEWKFEYEIAPVLKFATEVLESLHRNNLRRQHSTHQHIHKTTRLQDLVIRTVKGMPSVDDVSPEQMYSAITVSTSHEGEINTQANVTRSEKYELQILRKIRAPNTAKQDH